MEDYQIDVMIGKGATARSIRLELPKFTLVGATTRAGLLSAPLRDRFGVVNHLEYYTVKELETIIIRSANVLGVEIDSQGANELARRSRGTPRLANRLLKRVRDFAQVKYDGRITGEVADYALNLLDVDRDGLDANDRLILGTIIKKFGGGPVGLTLLQHLSVKMPEHLKMYMSLILYRMDLLTERREDVLQRTRRILIWGLNKKYKNDIIK